MRHNCIRCEKELEDVGVEPSGQPQPYEGLTFYTRGHYGSTYFDPMGKPLVLQLVVCDECIKRLEEDGRVTHWRSWTPPSNWEKVTREEAD